MAADSSDNYIDCLLVLSAPKINTNARLRNQWADINWKRKTERLMQRRITDEQFESTFY
jgi:hypothetical protein